MGKLLCWRKEITEDNRVKKSIKNQWKESLIMSKNKAALSLSSFLKIHRTSKNKIESKVKVMIESIPMIMVEEVFTLIKAIRLFP